MIRRINSRAPTVMAEMAAAVEVAEVRGPQGGGGSFGSRQDRQKNDDQGRKDKQSFDLSERTNRSKGLTKGETGSGVPGVPLPGVRNVARKPTKQQRRTPRSENHDARTSRRYKTPLRIPRLRYRTVGTNDTTSRI
jgi:hypothetical protein